MNQQTQHQEQQIEIQEVKRTVYVKPCLEIHPSYKTLVALGGSI
jgi:hypothetical protein